jgi:hypothetical protein
LDIEEPSLTKIACWDGDSMASPTSTTGAQSLAQLDHNGKTMAEIQIESARYIWDLAEQERAKPEPQQEAVTRLMTAARANTSALARRRRA